MADNAAEDAKMKTEIGIIGGSGLYEMEGFTDVREGESEPAAEVR